MIPGFKSGEVCYAPKSKRIIHHKKHSYDEHGNVVVIDDVDEDRVEFVNSFKDTVGLKNILRQLQLTGQIIPASFMYNEEQDAIDVSGMPDNINDLKAAADQGDQVIRDAVKQFNDAYGTSYTVEEFIKKSADGSLVSEVTTLLNEKEKEKDGDK